MVSEGDRVIFRVPLKGKKRKPHIKLEWDAGPIPTVKGKDKVRVEWDTTGVQPGHYAISVTLYE